MFVQLLIGKIGITLFIVGLFLGSLDRYHYKWDRDRISNLMIGGGVVVSVLVFVWGVIPWRV